MLGVQLVVAQAEPGSRSRRKILYENISLLQQRGQDTPALLVLEVQCQGLLAAVRPHKVTAHAIDSSVIAACKVTDSWTLNLDYTRAEVGKLTGGEGGGDGLFQRHDGHTCERLHTCGYFLFCKFWEFVWPAVSPCCPIAGKLRRTG